MIEIICTRKLSEAMEVLSRLGPHDEVLIARKHSPHFILDALKRVENGVFDFDGTATSGSQWKALGTFLPKNYIDEETVDRDWYYSLIMNGFSEPPKDPDEWWIEHVVEGNMQAVEGAWAARAFERFKKSGITQDDIVSAAAILQPREGLAKLFSMLDRRVIVTFGIENVVKEFLAQHELEAQIAATRIEFDANGAMTGYNRNVVVSATKAVAVDRYRELYDIKDPRSILAVGDSVVDIHMMPVSGVNVLLLPTKEMDRKLKAFRDNHIEKMWEKLSCVLASESLQCLPDLLAQARA